jgi:hypothetical protein
MPRSKTEVVKTLRSLESGQSDDPVHNYKFEKKIRMSEDDPFKIVRTREEVDMQWTRASVSAALPISSFHNKEVHRVVLMTAEYVENYNYRLTSWSYVTVTVCGGGT